MSADQRERPQGRHVRPLRLRLGLNQTHFAALLRLNQPEVSSWESPKKRDKFLPPGLAKRFLEVSDCFPTRPAGGYNEMMSRLSDYRSGNVSSGRKLVRMVPQEHVSANENIPEIYWALGEPTPTLPREAIPGQGASSSPESNSDSPHASRDTRDTREGEQEIVRLDISLLSLVIVFRIWSRAQRWPSAVPLRRLTGGLAVAACLACCTLITGCLLSHRAPDEPTAREPLRLPEKLYTDNATDGNGSMGTQSKHSVKMPDKPYSWQKTAPCDGAEAEENGGCWQILVLENPPCPEYAVENAVHKCLMPIPAKPKKPNTVEPTK